MKEMKEETLRKKIRAILRESEGLYVSGARKVGIDHNDGFIINLSDGREDYAPLKGFVLNGTAPAMYGCTFITGTLQGRLDGGVYRYEFDGIDCEHYVEVDVKTIRLSNQIS